MSTFKTTADHTQSVNQIRLIFFSLICLPFLVHGTTAFADSASPEINVGNAPELHAGDEKDAHIAYKLSLSNYATHNLQANDINLRADLDNQRGWIGYYKESATGFEQWRAGYERTDHIGLLDIDSSLQAADHDFLGGSITATIGAPFFGIIGYGRTNLKPYANLNFDPNDAITLGAGYKIADDSSVTLFLVRDNRVVPGQQNLHLLIKSPLPNQQRLTLDVFNKSGPADQGQSIHGTGASITYDWSKFFVRFAYDPKVNFTQEYMTRTSIGMYF
ncbi:MAG: hypothetical protein V4445_06970 [Pseudomonadota bacterium]